MSNTHVGAHPMIPRFIRLFSVPIFLGWIAIVVIVNIAVPQLEVVGEAHAVSFAPRDAPSLQAMQRIGKTFQEFDSNSAAMVVLEGDQPLGDAAHKYYDGLIDKLEADKKARPARPGLLGRPADGIGCAERRRQGRLRPAQPGGQPG